MVICRVCEEEERGGWWNEGVMGGRDMYKKLQGGLKGTKVVYVEGTVGERMFKECG